MGSIIVVTMLLLCTLILAAYTTALKDGENGSCCESITLSSGGMGDFYQGERLGHFVRSGSSSSGRAIYTQTEGTNHLFYLVRMSKDITMLCFSSPLKVYGWLVPTLARTLV